MDSLMGSIAIYGSVAIVLLVMLYISAMMWRRAFFGDERPLLLSQMLGRQGLRIEDPLTRQTGYAFAAAVRRCVNCVQQASCADWLDAGNKSGYEKFCPNAGYIEELKSNTNR